ncbi:MAG: hypothetical protein O3B31_11320 [Chloroflexi bacterium]|nr:hypothetical protein [Chloroflexota bacterium]
MSVGFITLRLQDGLPPSEGVALGLGAIAGAALLTGAVRTEDAAASGVASTHLLTDTELRRDKRPGDRWVLVYGAPSSGKSSLIDAMLRATESGRVGRRGWRAARARRDNDAPIDQVAEIELSSGDGAAVTVRVLETSRMDIVPTGRALGEMDVILLVFDPTQLASVAETFPQGVRPPSPIAEDGDHVVLQCATMIARSTAETQPVVWAVISKADLIRFSVAPALVAFPVSVGPAWLDQMARMQLPERRRLGRALGLSQLTQDQDSFGWGGGSPLLAQERAQARSEQSFGGAEILAAILDYVA